VSGGRCSEKGGTNILHSAVADSLCICQPAGKHSNCHRGCRRSICIINAFLRLHLSVRRSMTVYIVRRSLVPPGPLRSNGQKAGEHNSRSGHRNASEKMGKGRQLEVFATLPKCDCAEKGPLSPLLYTGFGNIVSSRIVDSQYHRSI